LAKASKNKALINSCFACQKSARGKEAVDLLGQKESVVGSMPGGSRWRLAWLRRRLLLTTWKVGNCEGSDNNAVVLVLLELKLLLKEMLC